MLGNEDYILCVEHLSKCYGATEVLQRISFKVRRGKILTILGPSGAGKSTLLNIIAGTTSPTRGRIFLKGEEITFVPIHRRNIGVVFQGYALFPHMNVFDNVAFPLRMRSILSKAEMHRKVHGILETVGLRGTEKRYPKELSGGQQQRVALAGNNGIDADRD